jgi:hypothetical protein
MHLTPNQNSIRHSKSCYNQDEKTARLRRRSGFDNIVVIFVIAVLDLAIGDLLQGFVEGLEAHSSQLA